MNSYQSDSAASDSGSTHSSDLAEAGDALLRRYTMPATALLGLACMIALGFAIRILFANQLAMVVGAMFIWFALIFAAAGGLLAAAFSVQGTLQKR